MAELLAAGAAARLAVAAFSAAAAERDVAPELRALQLRVLAAASSVEAAGAAFERDARAAPLVRTLEEATAWVERRTGKLEAQNWLHKSAMSQRTKAEIARLDGEITKWCADLNLSASFGVFQLEGASAELRAAVAGLDAAQKALLVELRERDAAARNHVDAASPSLQ